MAESFRICVVTGDATLLDRQVSYANLPTGYGSVGILARHAPMFCAVAKGLLRCTTEEGNTLRMEISDGVASVEKNVLTVLMRDARLLE